MNDLKEKIREEMQTCRQERYRIQGQNSELQVQKELARIEGQLAAYLIVLNLLEGNSLEHLHHTQ